MNGQALPLLLAFSSFLSSSCFILYVKLLVYVWMRPFKHRNCTATVHSLDWRSWFQLHQLYFGELISTTPAIFSALFIDAFRCTNFLSGSSRKLASCLRVLVEEKAWGHLHLRVLGCSYREEITMTIRGLLASSLRHLLFWHWCMSMNWAQVRNSFGLVGCTL